MNVVKIQENVLVILKIEATGNKRVISTSKIKKIKAIKKNRKEKGNRADFLGSNPHSYGEFFSRSIIVFFAKTEDNNITMQAIKKVRKEIVIINKIIFSKIYRLSDWKSNILSYIKKITSSSINKHI